MVKATSYDNVNKNIKTRRSYASSYTCNFNEIL